MKNLFLLSITIFWGLFIACGPTTDQQANNPPAEAETSLPEPAPQILIGYEDYAFEGALTRNYQEGTTEDELSVIGCDQWELSPKKLENVLLGMKKVSSEAYYMQCFQHPCWYAGTIGNGTQSLTVTIGSGGYILLKNGETEMYFIAEEFSELFIDACDCCADEE